MLPMLVRRSPLALPGASALLPSLFEDATLTPPMPAFDVHETADSWELLMDFPGVAKENLKITLDGDVLTVRGSRQAPETAEGSTSRVERWAGEVTGSFRLGDGLDSSAIEASLRDGVLRVKIAKAAAAKPREIAIQ